jgi:AcrR family transcriptional regulator
MMMTWERARSEDQIEHRTQQIVDATSQLYKIKRFEEITMAMIAREASFTRSNLYRYFRTKEEIFLELLKNDIARWRDDLLHSLPDKGITAHDFSEQWVSLMLRHERMISLFSILYTLLEPNASLESLVAFKRGTVGELGLITERLTRILPFDSTEAAADFLVAQSALAIGLYPMSRPTCKQKAAMETIGMASASEHYRVILSQSIISLVLGFIDKIQSDSRAHL